MVTKPGMQARCSYTCNELRNAVCALLLSALMDISSSQSYEAHFGEKPTLYLALFSAIRQVSGWITKSKTMHWILFLSEPSLRLPSMSGTSHISPGFVVPSGFFCRLLVATATCKQLCLIFMRFVGAKHMHITLGSGPCCSLFPAKQQIS